MPLSKLPPAGPGTPSAVDSHRSIEAVIGDLSDAERRELRSALAAGHHGVQVGSAPSQVLRQLIALTRAGGPTSHPPAGPDLGAAA